MIELSRSRGVESSSSSEELGETFEDGLLRWLIEYTEEFHEPDLSTARS